MEREIDDFFTFTEEYYNKLNKIYYTFDEFKDSFLTYCSFLERYNSLDYDTMNESIYYIDNFKELFEPYIHQLNISI